MKSPHLALFIVGLVLVAGSQLGFAQNRPGVPQPGRPVLVGASSSVNESEVLSTNYQVTFSGASEGKSLGELTLLTCSPQISVSGPLASGPAPTLFTVIGTLSEKEGDLILSYSISYSFPVTSTPAPGQNAVTNTQYQQHSSQGMLRMKAGTAYEVLKAAGVTYTITISNPANK